MHGLPQTKPNVDHAKSGNSTTKKIVQKNLLHGREIKKEEIVFPVLRPGEDQKEKAQFKAEKYENGDKNLVSH
jgi:hypothetical protein